MAGESIGGRATRATLEALPRDRWRVLHGLPWPGRPTVHVDHVVVGRAGVFVLDADAAGAARAIVRQLRNARCPVQPVLCLERDEPISADYDGVLVCSTASLASLLAARPEVLTDVEARRIAQDLAGRTQPRSTGLTAAPAQASGHGVAYLLGALVALAVALTLVARPDVATGAVEDVARWFAERMNDAG